MGTSGYHYDHWRGLFYPESLSKEAWFGHFAENFDTVEINNTFYQLPDAGTFDAWRDRAPQDFLYALKFSRYGMHLKHQKLTAEAGRIADQLARGFDVYAYFNNDIGGYAVFDATDIRRYVETRCRQ